MIPFFSIIIPTFNRSHILSRAIESVLLQSFFDWELIIVDDGSNDSTDLVIQKFLNDPRIFYFFQTNRGVTSARNFGTSKAKGEFLIFLDSDDQLTINAISTFRKAILEHPDKSVYTAGFIKKDQKGNIQLIKEPTRIRDISNFSGTFTIRKRDFILAGQYDSFLKFSENTELFHRFKILDYSFQIIPFPTLIYNDNPQGGSKNLRNLSDAINYILIKHERTLSRHVKWLYWRILGVNHIRSREFSISRKAFWNAWCLKPWSLGTSIRFMISCFPLAAIFFYSKVPRKKNIKINVSSESENII